MRDSAIMHVITGTAIGGAEIMLLRYLESLGDAARQHRVVSMMPRGPVAPMIAALGVGVDSLQVGNPAMLPLGVARMRRLIMQHQPAVMHGWMYHGSLMATLGLAMTRRQETGLIWAIHHSLADPAREKAMTRGVLRLLRQLSGRADAISYCSDVSRSQHRAFGLPQDRDVLIPNAIDTARFRPDPGARARLEQAAGIPAGRLVLGNIGRAHPMKDHAAFAKVVAGLAARGLDVHGVVIGAGQPDGPAVQAAAEAGISDRLTALPARDDIPALVPGFDLYLLSSAWGEALPLAVAEAMAAGVPAMVTDVGDCGWLVDDPALTCPPGDIAAMTGAAARVLSLAAPERTELGLRGRHLIETRMAPEQYIAAHRALYQSALEGRMRQRRDTRKAA